MKKLSVKWKIFLVFNYVQLIAFGILLLSMSVSFFRDKYRETTDVLYFCLFALAFLLLCLNNFLNVYAVHRYFPSTPVSSRNKAFMKTTGIIHVLLSAGMLFLLIISLNDELAHSAAYKKTWIISLAVLFFLWAIGVYTLILQFGIFRFLKRNYESAFVSLVNSIGTE